MKATFTLILVLSSTFIFAQTKWKRLTQRPLEVTYKIPNGWFIGGYMKDPNCKCMGATINTAPDRSVNMVIFESNQFGLDSLKKQQLWGYTFLANLDISEDSLETAHLQYTKALSSWKEDNTLEVLRFATTYNETSYLIYFWGEKDDIERHQETIDIILHSIEPAQ
ncbi:MAG: hypothetical protein GY810_22505 [Aureispira sp.]|nr:hypothetical protein [Aureispira sp.]